MTLIEAARRQIWERAYAHASRVTQPPTVSIVEYGAIWYSVDSGQTWVHLYHGSEPMFPPSVVGMYGMR